MKVLTLDKLTEFLTLLKTNILDKKVDKVEGKQLSTEDYTTTEKQKLAGLNNYELPTASDTVKGGVKVGAGLKMTGDILSATGGGTADAVAWQNVVGKPTKLSEFTNDQGFISEIPTEYITETELTSKGYQTNAQVKQIINTEIVEITDEELEALFTV